MDRAPGKLEGFYWRFMAVKVVAILVCCGMLGGFWYSILKTSEIVTLDNGSFSGQAPIIPSPMSLVSLDPCSTRVPSEANDVVCE